MGYRVVPQLRFLSVGRVAFCIDVVTFLSSILTRGCLPISLPPIRFLALSAMTQFSEWQHSSSGSLSASINRYRHHPSALCTCSSGVQLPNHLTCGLHPSSVDAPVDVHDPSHNFPFFHPWEALLVGRQVFALPSCSCGIIILSPPKEVVLQGVGLVHLYRV